MKQRSLGVEIFGVLFICIGVLGFLVEGLRFYSAQLPSRLEVIEEYGRRGLYLLGMAAGIGVLRRRRWAHWLTLVLVPVNVGLIVIEVVVEALSLVRWETWCFFLLFLGWNGLVLGYFLRPGVRAQFQVKQQHSS